MLNIIRGFEELLVWGKAGIETASPGVWVEGVEGAELGDGPAVFAVPELFAGPEEDTGCFLFLPIWFFETFKYIKRNMLGTNFILYISCTLNL